MEKEAWWDWLLDWLARPGVARLKGRIKAGRASFVTASVARAQNTAEAGRLYSHYRLDTGPVLRGGHGLSGLRERFGKPGELLASLSCSHCRHEFVVAVAHGADPLFLPAPSGGAAGYPASYSADWFRLWHPDCPGEPSLDCPLCESSGRPEFRLL